MTGGYVVPFPGSKENLPHRSDPNTHLAVQNTLKKRRLNFLISLLNMESPKVQKVSHWRSKNSSVSQLVTYLEVRWDSVPFLKFLMEGNYLQFSTTSLTKKKLDQLGSTMDYTTQLYRDYNKPL